ncbi:MAG: hypothetical protein Q7S92_03935 [Candidatus Diapherotrites archaeon]|nr:hypothetical protein [Candidatus Diapherotrites archaeon]
MKYSAITLIALLVLFSLPVLAQVQVTKETDVLVLTAGVPVQKVYLGNDFTSTQLTWYVWNISNKPLYLLQAKVSGVSGCKYNFFPVSPSSGNGFFNCNFANTLPQQGSLEPVIVYPGRIYQIPVTLTRSLRVNSTLSFPLTVTADLNVVLSTHPGYLSAKEFFRLQPHAMDSFYRNNGYVRWNEQHFVSKQSWTPFKIKTSLIDTVHFNIKLKASNACISGPTAAPKLLFNWRFDGVNENTCTAGNTLRDSNFCDLTQLSISLTQRLQKLRNAAPTERARYLTFDQYLLADNYASTQFMQDFNNYYTNQAFLGESAPFFADESTGWHKYFAQNKIVYDLSAVQNTALDSVSGKYLAGKYGIQLEFDPAFDYSFFQNNNPTTIVRVRFTNFEPVQYQTPLHSFAFDGKVGQETRRDYGTGFAPQGTQPSLNIADDFVLSTANSSTIFSKTNYAYSLNENSFDGNVLKVTEINSATFAFDFAPTQANPVLLGGLQNRAYYTILDESGTQVNKNRINKLTLAYAEHGTCSNRATVIPETVLNNAEGENCRVEHGYGFNIPVLEKSFYTTVLYTPYGRNYSIASACNSRDTQILATPSNTIAPYETNTIALSNTLDKANSVQELIELIRNERLCMKPAQGTDTTWAYYWNEGRILLSLDSIKERFNRDFSINLEDIKCPRDES